MLGVREITQNKITNDEVGNCNMNYVMEYLRPHLKYH